MNFNICFSASLEPVIISKCPEIVSICRIIWLNIYVTLWTAPTRVLTFFCHFPNILSIMQDSQSTCPMIGNHYCTLNFSANKFILDFFKYLVNYLHFFHKV